MDVNGWREQIEAYCASERIPVPEIAVMPDTVPDVYVTGFRKERRALVITTAAAEGLPDREIYEQAMGELSMTAGLSASAMATFELFVAPKTRLHERYVNMRYMRHPTGRSIPVSGDIVIREANDADLIGMYRLGMEAFRSTTGFSPLHRMVSIYRKVTAISLVVEDKGRPAGFLIGQVKAGRGGPFGRIDMIAVDGDSKGKGMGRSLTAFFLNVLESYGCRHCCLEVWDHNAGAIALYGKLGFIEKGALDKFYRNGERALIMCKKI